MTPLVLTLIGDDRAGLVSAVAGAVSEHGGNWDRSQMAELAGKFAGIVLVTIPAGRVDEFTAALTPLQGLLDVTVQRADEAPAARVGMIRWSLELLGSDRPGIVSDISAVLADHGVSIEAFSSLTREAPMASGMLFEANAELDVPTDADVDALRAALEDLAHELMVDIDLGTAD
ncbi:glycine cleavage system protein R [Ilumatobacter sp.]|uniref:glycine cleavage system protein R n=1 Tax=Ilumatobacter sp. TaxID=1967498 RepID=UPI003AF45182